MISRHEPSSRNVDNGYILVTVLSVMLLVTGLVAAGLIMVRSAVNGAKIIEDDVALAGLMQSGVEITAYELAVSKVPPKQVDNRPIKLTNGIVTPHIVDESGKVDLNGSAPQLLQLVFESTGMESSTAAIVVSEIVARRSDSSDRFASSAALKQPAVKPSDQPKRRGLQSLSELAEIPDLSRKDLRAVAGRLTVYNPDGKINVLTADPELLSLIPDLTKPVVADIIAKRGDDSVNNIRALYSEFGEATRFITTDYGPAFHAQIEATSLSGRKKVVDVVLAASRSPNAPYYILDWQD